MADHHDHLDSALDLLRSRQWAGPATNPVLEKQFMHPNQEPRGLNLRLVLSVAGALIGCGAVAAATRPAWRTAVFGAAPQPPKAVAAAAPAPAPAPAASTPTRVARRTPAPAPAARPAEQPVEQPAEQASGSFRVAEAPASHGEIVVEGMDLSLAAAPDEGEWLRTADPDCYYQEALTAYLERYVAGDYEGCAAIARAADGVHNPLSIAWARLGDMQRSIELTANSVEGSFLGQVRLDFVIGSMLTESAGAGEGVFELRLQPDLIETEGVLIGSPTGDFVRIEGLPRDGQGEWLFTTVAPAAPSPVAPPPPR